MYRYYKTHDKITMSVTFAICLVLLLGFFRAERYPSSLRNLPRIRKFLKLYSPNIQIFSDTSSFKQEIEFLRKLHMDFWDTLGGGDGIFSFAKVLF